MNRQTNIALRVSLDERKRLEALAKATGQNLSEVVRELLAQAELEPKTLMVVRLPRRQTTQDTGHVELAG